ncbi:MAG TPA: response regulator [Thermoanaerobaculia bacterium]|nr:response regulator [Thermoanaerobaculia bacterium]
MSLLGRLEDLSLADIVQIVFLSRRTGILEILDSSGRFTVLFRHGLIVNASSPESPDLVAHLLRIGTVDDRTANVLRQVESSGLPPGSALIDMNVVSVEAMADIIRKRVVDVVTPLLESKEGEFNFILSESIGIRDMEYDVDAIFREGGIAPQKIFGDGEKLKPLRGLEDSLKVGRSLLRPTAASEPTRPAEPGQPIPGFIPSQAPFPDPEEEGTLLPFPSAAEMDYDASLSGLELIADPEPKAYRPEESPFAEDPDSSSTPFDSLEDDSPLGEPFEVADRDDLFSREEDQPSPDADSFDGRVVVLFERDPLLRVAARRAFSKREMQTMQFGAIGDARKEIELLLEGKDLFITYLGLDPEDPDALESCVALIRLLKGSGRTMPVMVIDSEADLVRRHELLREGVDLYLTKPSPAHLRPEVAQQQLTFFADELVSFSQRAFGRMSRPEGGVKRPPGSSPTRERKSSLLERFIQEISSPEDVSQLSLTMLRVAGEYLSRVALFNVSTTHFLGAGGFSSIGDEGLDLRIRGARVARDEPSILRDVEGSRTVHRGKLRRDPQNVELLAMLGDQAPTEVAVFPVIHQDRCLAVLYGDNGGAHQDVGDTSGLEIFLSQAGFAFDNALFVSEASRKPSRDDR